MDPNDNSQPPLSVRLKSKNPDKVPLDSYIRSVERIRDMAIKDKLVNFLLFSFGGAVIATFAIFFFHGFKLGGFILPESLLRWLGVATIGEIGGLASLVYGAFFRGKGKIPKGK